MSTDVRTDGAGSSRRAAATAPPAPATPAGQAGPAARRGCCSGRAPRPRDPRRAGPGPPGAARRWPDWVHPQLVEALRAAGVTAPGRTRPRPPSSPGRGGRSWWRPARRRASRCATCCRRCPRSSSSEGRRGRAAPRHDALPRPHQGAGRRPAARAERAGHRRGAGGDVRRRHPDRVARLGAPPRVVRADQPRHAAPLDAARPPALGRASCAGCSYVVVDECHRYRGVFGSHVAPVLRRLRRVCAHYGSAPTFVLASATVSDPAGVGCAARRSRSCR